MNTKDTATGTMLRYKLETNLLAIAYYSLQLYMKK